MKKTILILILTIASLGFAGVKETMRLLKN